jgi:hypothetical protein
MSASSQDRTFPFHHPNQDDCGQRGTAAPVPCAARCSRKPSFLTSSRRAMTAKQFCARRLSELFWKTASQNRLPATGLESPLAGRASTTPLLLAAPNDGEHIGRYFEHDAARQWQKSVSTKSGCLRARAAMIASAYRQDRIACRARGRLGDSPAGRCPGVPIPAPPSSPDDRDPVRIGTANRFLGRAAISAVPCQRIPAPWTIR